MQKEQKSLDTGYLATMPSAKELCDTIYRGNIVILMTQFLKKKLHVKCVVIQYIMLDKEMKKKF